MSQTRPPLLETEASAAVKERVDALITEMTLAEKIGQMTQVEKNSITPQDVTQYFIGSVLSGGGGNPTPNDAKHWGLMVRAFQDAAVQTRLKIPLIYGSDAVHGHSNVYGAVIFPHNIGMGASRDADLVERCARITAKELLATGVYWDFAPAVSVPQDIRWGRTYEGYSDQTEVVVELSRATLRGLQNVDGEAPLVHEHAVLASVKHFVADGGTTWGSSPRAAWIERERSEIDRFYQIDQGDAQIDEATLRSVHLAPYVAAIEAGAQNIMVSFSSWQGLKMHAQKYLLTDVLKGEYGFPGFLVSDWMAINQLHGDFYTCVVTSINAGLDMIMVPFDFKKFIETLTQAVENGDVSMERIDDAVRRILMVKTQLGLFEKPATVESLLADFGSQAHREVAREAVRKTLVLLKNEKNALPLPKQGARLLVAGEAAASIGHQCGGWTIAWQGCTGPSTEGTSLLDALRAAAPQAGIEYSVDGAFSTTDSKAQVGIVALGEEPYAEGMGDAYDLTLSAADLDLVKRMRDQVEKLVVILYSGRPIIITDMLPYADAVVAAWLPGTEGMGLSDVLYGDHPFVGKLSYTWPRSMAQVPRAEALKGDPLFPFGYGLTY